MGEVTVLVLVIIQIFIICCCVYAVKSYCGSLLIVKRLIDRCFGSSNNEPPAETVSQKNIAATLSPVPPQQHPHVVNVYSQPSFAPYPMQQQMPGYPANFMMPSPYPAHAYPHEMGFRVLPPYNPSPSPALEDVVTEKVSATEPKI